MANKSYLYDLAEAVRLFSLEKSTNIALLQDIATTKEQLDIVEKEQAEALAELAELNEKIAAASRVKQETEMGQQVMMALPPQFPKGGSPFLVLSGYKLFRHRKFSLNLLVPTGWIAQNGLDLKTVMKCGPSITVRKEGSTAEEIKCCPICSQSKPVVQIAWTYRQLELVPCGNGYERITWDSCNTNCSSSRDHLKGRLVLELKLPGIPPIVSHPFRCQSRDKRSKTGPSRTQIADPTPVQPQSPVSASSLVSVLFDSCGSPTSGGITPRGVVGPTQQRDIPISFTEMSVLKTTGPGPEIMAMGNFFRNLIAKFPGFFSFRVILLPDYGCLLFYNWRTREAALASAPKREGFLANSGMNNLYGVDMLANGFIVPIGRFYSPAEGPLFQASSTPSYSPPTSTTATANTKHFAQPTMKSVKVKAERLAPEQDNPPQLDPKIEDVSSIRPQFFTEPLLDSCFMVEDSMDPFLMAADYFD